MDDPAHASLHPVTPETIAAALHQRLGLEVAPSSMSLEFRDWRWVATLPEGLCVYVADTPEHAARLEREARLLRLLQTRVHFAVPRLHQADPGLALQVRGMVPGAQLGGDGRERAFADQPQGARLAEELARVLAQLHGAITIAEGSALGFTRNQSILPGADVLDARLKDRLADPKIATTFAALIERYRAVEVELSDLVLLHGDVWGGNLAVDLATGALNGLFDFGDAGLGDRHLDLMYIHSFGEAFTRRLLEVYSERSKHAVSYQRTALYHAIAAFAALADTDNADGKLLEQRQRWIAEVCNGTIARIALNVGQ